MAEHIKDALVECLESGELCLGEPAIIFTIQDALLQNANGMYLWVAFQIDSICSQKTDETILDALKDLPKDLPETHNRILRKLHHSRKADRNLARTIFELVTAAQRPLDLHEIREALAVQIGETEWDTKRLVNDMLKSLSCCGSLLLLDEEYLTIQFTHYSVKEHILSKFPAPDLREYHTSLEDANVHLGCICLTYLNLDTFNSRLVKRDPTP
ncbi:hypothetical protein MMC18_001985 [Xylographa bjoerkii]|nr:hypothetical protein [Xylographa bjoerkii]